MFHLHAHIYKDKCTNHHFFISLLRYLVQRIFFYILPLFFNFSYLVMEYTFYLHFIRDFAIQEKNMSYSFKVAEENASESYT